MHRTTQQIKSDLEWELWMLSVTPPANEEYTLKRRKEIKKELAKMSCEKENED